jgi:hypothetical protein
MSSASAAQTVPKSQQNGVEMKHTKLMMLSLATLTLLLIGGTACFAATAKEAIASRQFLVGTWNCTFTVGSQGGPYTTIWSNVLDSLWLEQTYDQPRSPTAEPFKADYLIGYDERRQTWIRFGASTTGQYFAIRMSDTGDGNWSWKYASFFPRTTPETAGSDATFTKKSETEYTVDGPTYKEEGTGPLVTEHHICHKAA